MATVPDKGQIRSKKRPFHHHGFDRHSRKALQQARKNNSVHRGVETWTLSESQGTYVDDIRPEKWRTLLPLLLGERHKKINNKRMALAQYLFQHRQASQILVRVVARDDTKLDRRRIGNGHRLPALRLTEYRVHRTIYNIDRLTLKEVQLLKPHFHMLKLYDKLISSRKKQLLQLELCL